MNICLLRSLLESNIISQTMSQVTEIHDVTDSDDGKQIIRSLNRLNYKQGSSGFCETDNILRISNPAKRRQLIGYDEYPNFERQYIQNINIPSAAKTEGDNDQNLNQDDNYHFLMSLLPYLREVPKNRKMAIRHMLQKVFVEEQERKSGCKNINANQPNLNNFQTPFANTIVTDPMNQPQQTPMLPPPPYPNKQDVLYNCVPSVAGPSASVQPMPKAIPSTSTLFGNLIVQQPPFFPNCQVSVGLPSGNQQYYNAKANNNNKKSFSYNATTVDNKNANKNNNNSSFGYNATAMDNNNANNNNSSFSYNTTTVDNKIANNNSSFGYNATAVDNNNANNINSSFNYNATAVDNNNANNINSSFGYNATAVDNNNANNINSSFSYNTTTVDNDNATFTYQSEVTGEPQIFTYLQ